MNRVFVSYSRKNKAFAERLARDLGDAGLDVWIDFRQILGGEFWREEIQRGLDRADFMVACMSPEAAISKWVTREMNMVRDQGKPIVPIVIQRYRDAIQKNPELQWVSDIQYVNFENQKYDAAFTELLNTLPGSRKFGSYDQIDPRQIPNPFKGLEAFQQRDANFFFGREKLIQKSLNRLAQTRFLAVVGASGIGKSSLVRAGILPQLRQDALQGSSDWTTVIFAPGAQPIDAFIARLHPLLSNDTQQQVLSDNDIVAALSDSESVGDLVDSILTDKPKASQLLVFIDQFEELFTRTTEQERTQFINILDTASNAPNARIRFIVTMRTDFMGNVGDYPTLAEMFEHESLIIVTRMSTNNLLRAITGPGEAVGLEYEEGLVERILEEVGNQPGTLPLLQYTLSELFKRRSGNKLTLHALNEIGGVRKSLAQHAETMYINLPEDYQAIMQRILLRLVEVSDTGEVTRRRVDQAEIQFSDVPDVVVRAILDLLTSSESRLLVANREIRANEDHLQAPTTWVEVSHEALIRGWDRFQSWIKGSIQDLKYESELRKATQDWVVGGRDVAYLLTGRRLRRAEVWLESAYPTELQSSFIAASVAERDRREQIERERQQRELQLQRRATNRLRAFVIVLILGLIVAGILSALTIQNSNQIQSQNEELSAQATVIARTAAESLSLAVSANAEQIFSDNDTDLGLALAVESGRIEDPPIQSERTLSELALAPGTQLRVDFPSSNATEVVYDLNTNTAYIGDDEGNILILDTITGTQKDILSAHNTGILDLALSPNGSVLASATEAQDDEPNLTLWNLEERTPIASLPGHNGDVTSLVFSIDGQTVASGGDDGQVIVWDIITQEPLQTYDELTGEITRIAIQVDGTIAAGNNEGSVYILTPQSETQEFQSVLGSVSGLSFDPEENLLLVADDEGNFRLWNYGTQELIREFNSLDDGITDIQFVPDSDLFLVSSEDSTLRIWDTITFRQVNRFNITDPIVDVAVTENSNQLASISSQDMRIWNLLGSEQLVVLDDLPRRITSIAFDDMNQNVVMGTASGNLNVWDLETQQSVINDLATYSDNQILVSRVAVSPDGQHIVTASFDASMTLWDSESFAQTARFVGHEGSILALTFTPDSQFIVTGAADKTIRIWDVGSGSLIRTLSGHTGNIASVAVSQDGLWILSGSTDNTLILWELQTGRAVKQFQDDERIRTVAFSADATQIASGTLSGSIRIWDVESGQEISRFTEHNRLINGIVFIADDARILSSSTDGTIRLWDVQTGLEVHRYAVEDSGGRLIGVRSLAVNQDETQMLTHMNDNTIRVWQVLPTIDELLVWVQGNRFVPVLTCSDRIAFGLDTSATTAGNPEQVILQGNDTTPVTIYTDANTDANTLMILTNSIPVWVLNSVQNTAESEWWHICTGQGLEGWILRDLAP